MKPWGRLVPDKPLTISVYMTSYNQAEYFALAFSSVLNQTRKPDQIVIIDDASTDGSQDLIRSYQKNHGGLVTTIFNKENHGIAESRKRAIQATTGDLISSLDGDDLYLPNLLQKQEQALLDNPHAGFAYSNFSFIDESGDHVENWDEKHQLPSGDLFEHTACMSFANGTCFRNELTRRQALLETIDYEQGKNLYEDYEARLRLSRFHSAIAINEVTHSYRLHPLGLSRASDPRHHDALHYIYSKNAHLLDGIDPMKKRRIQAKINFILSEYAWGAVRQMAKKHTVRDHNNPCNGPLHYAKSAVARRPVSVLNPKRTSQLIRSLIRY